MDVARAAVDGDGVVAVADRVEHRALGIELLALLIVVGDLHVGARRTSPASGAISPSSNRSSVVLPAPLGPMSPMRSPRMMRVEKSRTTGSPANDLPTCSPRTRA